jgi:hypothetical protein
MYWQGAWLLPGGWFAGRGFCFMMLFSIIVATRKLRSNGTIDSDQWDSGVDTER